MRKSLQLSKIPLERVFTPANPEQVGIPLVILDFRVALHDILQALSSIPSELTPEGLAKFGRASWGVKFNRGPDCVPYQPYRLVIVDDCRQDGKYWRTLLSPDYKGNRDEGTPEAKAVYQRLKDIGHELARELSLPLYFEPLYEADDWAGLIHRIKKQEPPTSLLATREIYYLTVDSDWLQLVDDTTRQLWANTGPWTPRLRNEAETRAYILKRCGVRINHPNEIARVKQKQGDVADNLLAGANLDLFDLTRSHPKFDLSTLPAYANLVEDLVNPNANTRYDIYEKSVKYLSYNGLPICIKA